MGNWPSYLDSFYLSGRVRGRGGEAEEVTIDDFRFRGADGTGALDGPAVTVGGAVSTRRTNSATWLPITGRSPYGEWELVLPNQETLIDRFQDGSI